MEPADAPKLEREKPPPKTTWCDISFATGSKMHFCNRLLPRALDNHLSEQSRPLDNCQRCCNCTVVCSIHLIHAHPLRKASFEHLYFAIIFVPCFKYQTLFAHCNQNIVQLWPVSKCTFVIHLRKSFFWLQQISFSIWADFFWCKSLVAAAKS